MLKRIDKEIQIGAIIQRPRILRIELEKERKKLDELKAECLATGGFNYDKDIVQTSVDKSKLEKKVSALVDQERVVQRLEVAYRKAADELDAFIGVCKCGHVLRLYYINGLNPRRIAGLTGTSRQWVYKLIDEGLDELCQKC